MPPASILLRALAAAATAIVVAGKLPAQPAALTALVRHAPTLSGTIDGSVQQMTAESVTLNGGAVVTGDLFIPGLPAVRLNGHPDYAGTIDGMGAASPANHQVTLNGNAGLRHVIRRTDPAMLPAVAAPALPAGRVDVAIGSAGQAIGTFTALRNLTLNDGAGLRAIPAGVYGEFTANGNAGFVLGIAGATQPIAYDFQRFTLNGQSRLEVVGPVIVTVANGVTVNGSFGTAGHTTWLRVNVASGGLTMNGSATGNAFVNAPTGTVTLNGHSELMGGVRCDRLVVNGTSRLRLEADRPPNQPPLITLTSPVDGTVLTTPAKMTLVAAATDPDGSVAKVEFFEHGTKLGEDATPPFEFEWANIPPGSYVLTARAVDTMGGSAVSAPVNLVVRSVLPYFTSFEADQGYTLGALRGQGGWTAEGNVLVADVAGAEGDRAMVLEGGTPAEAVQTLPEYRPEPIVFADVFAKPRAGSTPDSAAILDVGFGQVAFVENGARGEVYLLQGDGVGGATWERAGFTSVVGSDGACASWIRLTLRGDFSARTWDFFGDGRLIAADRCFCRDFQTPLRAVRLMGSSSGETAFDDVYIGFDNPLFADADKDGIDDAWERANGLNPEVNDRMGDRDADGISNLAEYLRGTRADLADTDGDGMTDGYEVAAGRNPLVGAVADSTGVVNLRVYLPTQ